jgi:hypothetical protein
MSSTGRVIPMTPAEFQRLQSMAADVSMDLSHTSATSRTPVGSTLADRYRALPRTQNAYMVRKGATTLGRRLALRPALGAFGPISLAAGAFTVGWEIGSAIRGLWTTQRVPAAPAVPSPLKLVPRPKGYDLWDGGTSVDIAAPRDLYRVEIETMNNQAWTTQMPAAPAGKTQDESCSDYAPFAAQSVMYAAGYGAYPAPVDMDGTPFQNGAPDGEGHCYGIRHVWVMEEDAHDQQGDAGIDVKKPAPALMPAPAPATVETGIGQAQADLSTEEGAYLDWIAAQPEVGLDVDDPMQPAKVTIPPPNPRETATAYMERLQALGLLGHVEVLTENAADVELGADAIVRTRPAPGTRVATGTTVTIYMNPATIAPGSGTPGGPTTGTPTGGGCEPWVKPSIDLAPLGRAIPNVFPFGVPFWIAGALDAWLGTPQTPVFELYFPWVGEFEVSLDILDPHMPFVRSVLAAVSIVGLAWFFMSMALGFSAGRDRDD